MVDLCFVKKIETLIICHLVFAKRERSIDDRDLKIAHSNCGLGF